MKGIIFSGDHPVKIVQKLKSQTRQLINPQPVIGAWTHAKPDPVHYTIDRNGTQAYCGKAKSRYHIGEVVYIKEAWATEQCFNDMKPSEIPGTATIFYVSDGVGEWPVKIPIGKLRSSLFMPEWASRGKIRIIDVRPERLQDITLGDVITEGIPGYTFAKGVLSENPPDPRWKYIELWDSINKIKWESNPWLFRYCFELEGK